MNLKELRVFRLFDHFDHVVQINNEEGYLRPTPQNGQDCALRALYLFDISTVSKIANRLCLSASMHVGCAVSN
jgi:hypothetical protein